MYAIISGGVLAALCEEPRYVRKKAETGVYVETTAEKAEAVAVNGTLYNIGGGDAVPGAPQAVVRQESAGEYIFRNGARIEENREDADTAFIAVEDAVCELDASTDVRISNIEDALCELDMYSEGGVQYE